MTDLNHILQSIKERADRATEGPWFVENGGEFVATRKEGIAFDVAIIPDHLRQGEYPNSDYDAEFIASAKTDVPRLVEAVRVLAELAKEIEYAEEFGSLDAKYALQRATEILNGG